MEGARLSPTELIERLEQAWTHRSGPVIMASDGDGTIWRGDIGEEMFLAALRREALHEVARQPLLAEAAAHGVAIEAAAAAGEIGAKLVEALATGTYPEEPAFGMMAWAFAGWTESELAAFSDEVLDDFDFAGALRAELQPVLAWARKRDVPFWLVSASPLAIVAAAARRLGIPGDRVVAMEPALAGDVVQPRLAKPATHGEGKLTRLRMATELPLLAAFGDSGYDAAMLRAAEVPVAVHPKAELRKLETELRELVVIGDR